MTLGMGWQVRMFLDRIKGIVADANGRVQIVPRQQNDEFMAERGISEDDVISEILSLTVDDCFDGPEKDRDPRFSDHWTVAEFGPDTCYGRLYLKLSVCDMGPYGKVLSVKAYSEREGS